MAAALAPAAVTEAAAEAADTAAEVVRDPAVVTAEAVDAPAEA